MHFCFWAEWSYIVSCNGVSGVNNSTRVMLADVLIFLKDGPFFADMFCWQMHGSNCASCWRDGLWVTHRLSIGKEFLCCLSGGALSLNTAFFPVRGIFYWDIFIISFMWTGNYIWTCIKDNLLMGDLSMLFVVFVCESRIIESVQAGKDL